MAVQFNNTNAVQDAPAATNNPWSYSGFSVTAGQPNLCAFVWVGNSPYAATTATYGGHTMKPCGAAAQDNAGNYMTAFYLINPPTGTNTLVVNGADPGKDQDFYVNLVSFYGVNQFAPIRPGTYGTVTSSTMIEDYTITISSNVGDRTFSAMLGTTPTLTTNQTSDGTYGGAQCGSDHCTTPASSVTHTWSMSTAIYGALLGFSIQPPSVGPRLIWI